MAEMADRDRDDCHGFQPVGVVNGVRRVRVSMRCARRMHGVCAPPRPNLYSFSGTRRQLIIEAVSHVKFALTLPQPFFMDLEMETRLTAPACFFGTPEPSAATATLVASQSSRSYHQLPIPLSPTGC